MSDDPKKWLIPKHTLLRFVCDIRHNILVTSNLVFHRPIR